MRNVQPELKGHRGSHQPAMLAARERPPPGGMTPTRPGPVACACEVAHASRRSVYLRGSKES